MFKNFLALPVLGAALLGGASAIGATAAPASAQYLPPGYYGVRQAAITGVVTYFYQFNMTVAGPQGGAIPVQLHQGTIIAPLGATVVPGMRVTVRGYWSNGVFYANRIRIH